MKDSIIKEHTFSAPINKVWNAISKADEISSWFIKADFKAEAGYSYTFTSSDKENCTQITGVVREANPYILVYTWIVADTDAETVVSWTLEETAEGTHLKLVHSGISNYKGETAVAMFSSFDKGWANCVDQLQNYLKQEVHAG